MEHFLFLGTVCMPAYKVARPIKKPLASGQWPSNRAAFSMMKDFRQNSEDVSLPQLTGQISAHYSSSKIRKTHLHLFRPDQGPRAVLEARGDESSLQAFASMPSTAIFWGAASSLESTTREQ